MYLYVLTYLHKLWGKLITIFTTPISPGKESLFHQALVRLLDFVLPRSSCAIPYKIKLQQELPINLSI